MEDRGGGINNGGEKNRGKPPMRGEGKVKRSENLLDIFVLDPVPRLDRSSRGWQARYWRVYKARARREPGAKHGSSMKHGRVVGQGRYPRRGRSARRRRARGVVVDRPPLSVLPAVLLALALEFVDVGRERDAFARHRRGVGPPVRRLIPLYGGRRHHFARSAR